MGSECVFVRSIRTHLFMGPQTIRSLRRLPARPSRRVLERTTFLRRRQRPPHPRRARVVRCRPSHFQQQRLPVCFRRRHSRHRKQTFSIMTLVLDCLAPGMEIPWRAVCSGSKRRPHRNPSLNNKKFVLYDPPFEKKRAGVFRNPHQQLTPRLNLVRQRVLFGTASADSSMSKE